MDKPILIKKNAPKSLIKWSWILIVIFFALSFYDVRFALAGFICMLAPISFAVAGKGKIHCSHYCPRGSFFGKFLPFTSMNRTMPSFMATKWFKHGLLIFMIVAFGRCLYRFGWGYENIANAVFNIMLRSFLLGAIIGTVFMPRSWCRVCPMGHAAGMIRDLKNSKKDDKSGKAA